MPHIGQNIRALRILKGMKQASFAQLMGIPQQSVSRLEKQSSISTAKLERAAAILGVTIQAIERLQETAITNNKPFNDTQQRELSIDEVFSFIKTEIERRDKIIQQLRSQMAPESSLQETKMPCSFKKSI